MAESRAPLEGITVVDLSQFLAGPSASLRLADLGATVIKVERPEIGDICRDLYVSDALIEGDSTIFHAINRNKLGYQADLKDPADRERVARLVAQADVVMHNFRPGVIERLGLDYEHLRREPGYQALHMEQTVTRDGQHPVHTLRSPIRIDGERLFVPEALARVGRDNERIRGELLDG